MRSSENKPQGHTQTLAAPFDKAQTDLATAAMTDVLVRPRFRLNLDT